MLNATGADKQMKILIYFHIFLMPLKIDSYFDLETGVWNIFWNNLNNSYSWVLHLMTAEVNIDHA